MTTAREIKRLVTPLLERQPDVALIERMYLVVHPVRHVLRCVCIDRSWRKTLFRPTWVLAHLCTGRRGIWVKMGGSIFPPRPATWELDVPGVEERFCAKVEAEVLPRLRAVETLADYVEIAVTPEMFQRPMAWKGERMIVHAAMGEIEAARELCVQGVASWGRQDWEDMQGMADRWKHMADLVLADDRAGMIALLHEMEALTAADLKIDHLWERTPFPLETGAARIP